jgi:phosphoribosylanthranilate isomerase
LTRLEEAQAALEAGADFLGIVFHPKSPRYLARDRAAALVRGLREMVPAERVRAVGVFVRCPAEEVLATVREVGLAAVQLHGDEDLKYIRSLGGAAAVIRAVRIRDATSLAGLEAYQASTAAFLFDAHSHAGYGGTGQTFAHDLARPWIERHPVLVAGGLTPDSVGEVVRAVRPFGVDVSSGVEVSPGVKDPARIRDFIRAVRKAESTLSRDRASG